MKLKKVLSGFVSAAIVATSTAIVMPLNASAADDFITTTNEDITSKISGGLTYDELIKYDSLEFVYQPKAASACSHPAHNSDTSMGYCIWCGVAVVGVVNSNGEDTSGTSVEWQNDGVCYWWDNGVKAATYEDKQECTASISPVEIVNGIKSHNDWSDDYTINKIVFQGQDCTIVSATGSIVTIDLPENEYAFDTDTGTAQAYGQPAKTEVGEGKTITKEVLSGDFIIVVPYVSDSRPKIVLNDGKGDESSPTNWVQTSAKVVKNGTAYYTKDDILSSWIAAGGQADFTGVANILVAATEKEITATGVKLYAGAPAAVAVTGVTLDETELALTKNESATLTATVAPTNATDKTVTWESSKPEVATVDEDGKVTAKATGTAVITVASKSDSTKKATCTVTVTNPATAITLNKTELALKKGEADTLTATVTPTDADDEVEWTVAPSGVVTVDETGKVTAVKSGTATVTATAGTKSATCTVTVTNPATAIAIDETATVLVGAEKTLAVTTTPEDADALTYTWTSSDTDIATVEDGVVTGVAAGTATITAKAGALTATCTVTVSAEAKPATAVTLNKTTLDLEVEGTGNLTATLTPADSTDDITWTSSAPAVATVDETGKVTAVAAGTATITATANATVKAECKVTVTAKTIAITGVTLDKTTASVEEGKTVELTATVKPADTTEDKTVTWTSSDTTVATVKDGVVTAVKAGKATITATAGTKSATCAVTVTAAAKPDEPKDYETGKVETVTDYVPAEAPAAGTKTELMVNSISKADAATYSHYDVTIKVTLEDGTVKTATKSVYDCYAGFSYNNGDKVERAENGFFLLVKVKGVPESAKVEMSIKGIV